LYRDKRFAFHLELLIEEHLEHRRTIVLRNINAIVFF